MPRCEKFLLAEKYSSLFFVIIFAIFLFSLICVSIILGVIIMDPNPPQKTDEKLLVRTTRLTLYEEIIRMDIPVSTKLPLETTHFTKTQKNETLNQTLAVPKSNIQITTTISISEIIYATISTTSIQITSLNTPKNSTFIPSTTTTTASVYGITTTSTTITKISTTTLITKILTSTPILTCSDGQTIFFNTSLETNSQSFSTYYTFGKNITLETAKLCCLQCLLDSTCYIYDYEISKQLCRMYNPVIGMVTAQNDATVATIFFTPDQNHVSGYYY